MLAASSGKLDLAECGLTVIPRAIFDIEGLEELSLAGNELISLPPQLSNLRSLRRLQLSGNPLTTLPESLGALTSLEGIWLHGTRISRLPESIGKCTSLTQLSLSGTLLVSLPESLGHLHRLEELSAAGCRLETLPRSIGNLTSLKKLALNGNCISQLPSTIGELKSLKELWLQGNTRLTLLPDSLGGLVQLEQASCADCSLTAVPSTLGQLPVLQALTLYGNDILYHVPPEVAAAPKLKNIWLEGTAIAGQALNALLVASQETACKIGIDTRQAASLPPGYTLEINRNRNSVVISEIVDGKGPGYFKLEVGADSGEDKGNKVLVISFGSAPGIPNWAGLLKRIKSSASVPIEADFDVLYVVDPAREWYGGGDEAAYQYYYERLESVSKKYLHVIMIGDSMGATAALLFSQLATDVVAFCPQIDLKASSIRCAHDDAWFDRLKERVLKNMSASSASICVHVGNWAHDINQVKDVPGTGGHVKIWSVDSHRLAAALDRRDRLSELVKAPIMRHTGGNNDGIRLVNLL